MPDTMRLCPSCGELQEWCDRPECDGPLPRGHWTHLADEAARTCPGLLADLLADLMGGPDA